MIVRRIYPLPVDPAVPAELDTDEPTSRARLLDFYRPPSSPWLRLNFVVSVSGGAGGSDGTSATLTSRTDRRILGVIRELSDVVLIGAGSLRAEGYLRPQRARLAVVTASGDLDGHALSASDEPLIVMCPESAVSRVLSSVGEVKVEIIELAESHGTIAAADIVAALNSAELTSIVCEGGPHLARELLTAGFVNEVCLTTSAVLDGANIPILGAESFASQPVTLTQLLVDESSALYARWLVSPPSH